MVVNGGRLLSARPIDFMHPSKMKFGNTSYGLGEAGYDITLSQDIIFKRGWLPWRWYSYRSEPTGAMTKKRGRFILASSMECFDMPNSLVGIVHDKSTLARQGLSVFNTVIEPGWKGYLTLELVYHGHDTLILPMGTGIAQVLFHELSCKAVYEGRYQNQPDRPVLPIPF